MAIFRTQKPHYPASQWFKFVIARVIFPPILLWDLLKYGVSNLAGGMIGQIILAPPSNNIDISSGPIRKLQSKLHSEQHTIYTYDGAALNSCVIINTLVSTLPFAQQKYIINFVGNQSRYENIIDAMRADAEALHCHVVGFSSGIATSKNHLLIDGIAQVQWLLDRGVSPKNITLKGHSLGGAIATLVAYHFHQNNKPVNVFSDRSFSSLSKLVSPLVQRHLLESIAENERAFIPKLRAQIIGLICKLLVSMSNWNIQASGAFKKIPEDYREYIVIRQRGVDGSNIMNDDIVHYEASIHTALKHERQAKKTSLQRRGADLAQCSAQFKARKMTIATGYTTTNIHGVNLAYVTNRYGESGLTFFRTFVQRSHQDRGLNLTASCMDNSDTHSIPESNKELLLPISS